MKTIEINSSEDLLHLEVIELLGLLGSMTITEECDNVTLTIKKIGSNYGNFKYDISCEKITEDKSIMDKIKRWFKI